MTFPSLSNAQSFSRTAFLMIHVRIEGEPGVFQIYPGGRTIRWPDTDRHIRRLEDTDRDLAGMDFHFHATHT